MLGAMPIQEMRLVTVVIPAAAVSVIPAVVMVIVRASFINDGRARLYADDGRRRHFHAGITSVAVTTRRRPDDEQTEQYTGNHFAPLTR